LKRVEFEAFSKSFLLFFISMGLLIVILFYINYQKELQNLDKDLLSKMNICNFTLKCKEFKLEFVKRLEQKTYKLYKNKNYIGSLYPLKDSKDYYLKLSISPKEYHTKIHYLHKEIFIYLIITLIVVLILSILFSFYSLYPLKNALHLTQEFVRDILHDFNTPLSTIRLNLSVLHKEIGDNKKILRIERGVENILLLQENLKHYLIEHKEQYHSQKNPLSDPFSRMNSP
jgi:hypothetical protein